MTTLKLREVILSVAIVVLIAGMFALIFARQTQGEIVGVTPQQVKWFTPPYYKDGRQRAQLYGDSSKDGVWVDRVKIPADAHVLAHTHPHDELVTVIEGTWYVGEGEKYDATRLKAYPAGSFVVIPAGLAHFVATKKDAAIVQVNGVGKFATEYVEK